MPCFNNGREMALFLKNSILTNLDGFVEVDPPSNLSALALIYAPEKMALIEEKRQEVDDWEDLSLLNHLGVQFLLEKDGHLYFCGVSTRPNKAVNKQRQVENQIGQLLEALTDLYGASSWSFSVLTRSDNYLGKVKSLSQESGVQRV